MIVMGNAVNGNLLKAAAEAHLKAIGSIDARGVTSAADYQAVNSALNARSRTCQCPMSWTFT